MSVLAFQGFTMKIISEENLLNQHRQDLSQTRKLISFLIEQLNSVITEKKFEPEFVNDWKYIWGEKENAVSVLTKLTGLLVKVVPMEQELDSQKPVSEEKLKGGVLTDDDKAIIRRYVERQSLKD
jgi:hypothetical protein